MFYKRDKIYPSNFYSNKSIWYKPLSKHFQTKNIDLFNEIQNANCVRYINEKIEIMQLMNLKLYFIKFNLNVML